MSRVVVALVCVLVTTGCQGNPTHGVSRSPLAASPSPTQATSTASPYPPPAYDLPLSQVTFSCRLPVVTVVSGATQVYEGGFITFPAATYQADPAGVVQGNVTDAEPVLHGSGYFPFYDLALHRWVPARPAHTSPDGALYAYSTDATQIHVVDVASGSDRVITLGMQPQGASIEVADFDGRRVYFLYEGDQGYIGVWRLDVASGAVARVANLSGVDAVQAGYAWVSAIDPRDPKPPQYQHGGPPVPASDSVVRVDMATGARTVWFYAPGQAVVLRTLDNNGHPVVEVAPSPVFELNGNDLRLVSIPGDQGTQLYKGPTLNFLSEPQRDVGRMWFGNRWGIYLFTGSNGLRKVFDLQARPSEFMQPAGFCV